MYSNSDTDKIIFICQIIGTDVKKCNIGVQQKQNIYFTIVKLGEQEQIVLRNYAAF